MEDIIWTIVAYAVVIAIVGLPIYLIIKKKNNNKGKAKTNVYGEEEGQKALKARYIEGISYLREDQSCKLYVDNEKLTIVADGNKQFNIMLEQVVNAGMLTKKEVEMKNKSVVARGLVGGVFGLGLLGAMSGIGQKAVKKSKFFLVINYKAKDSEDVKILSFGCDYYAYFEKRFLKTLISKIDSNNVNVDL